MTPFLLALAFRTQATPGTFYGAIAWTPYGLALGESFGSVRFRGTGSSVPKPFAVPGGARAIVWNEKGRFLVVLGGKDLRLFSLPSRRTVRVIPVALRGEPFALAVDPSGRRAVVGTNDGDAAFFDLTTGTRIARSSLPLGLGSFAFSADGTSLAAGSGEGVTLVDGTTRKVRRSYPIEGPKGNVYALRYSSGGGLVLAVGDGTIRTLQGDRTRMLGRRGQGQCVDLAFVDSDRFAVVYDSTHDEPNASALAFFSLKMRRRLTRASLPGHPVAVTSHGGVAYVLLADGRVEIHRPPGTTSSSSRSPSR